MARSEGNENLRRLLRLKSYERPDEAFWEDFDAAFQSRRLGALMGKPVCGPIRWMLRRLCGPAVAVFGTACAALILCLCPRDRGADVGVAPPSEFLSLALAQDIDEGVFVEEICGESEGEICYVAELPSGPRRPLLAACNF